MSSVLVDTNVVSWLYKGDSRAAPYVADLSGKRVHVAFITVAELRQWALLKNWGPKSIESLEQALRHYVVLGFDDQTAWRWAEVGVHQRKAGRNRHDRGDWWIAACALRHGMPLVTANSRDFVGIPGLEVISHPR